MIGKLTLDQLRVLVTIVDTGSFSAAGRKLGRAQSAISQAIATLESVHDVTLFDRSGLRPPPPICVTSPQAGPAVGCWPI